MADIDGPTGPSSTVTGKLYSTQAGGHSKLRLGVDPV